MDSAQYTYEILSQESFSIAHFRFGAALTQLLPLLFIKLGFSLKAVLIAYSLNFVIIYYLVWLFCQYVARNSAASLALILLLFTGARYIFFWPVSELMQGLVYSLGFYAWLSRADGGRGPAFYLVSLFWLSLAMLTHPLSILGLGFLWGLAWIERGQFRDYSAYAVFLMMVVGWFLIRTLKPPTPYETELMERLNALPGLLPDFFNLPGTRGFFGKILANYKYLIWLGAGTVLIMLLLKKFREIGLMAIGAAGILVLSIGVYPNGESEIVMENMRLPLILVLVVVFSKTAFPALQRYRLGMPIVLLVLIFDFQGISRAANEEFRYRREWHENMYAYARQFPERKLVMDLKHFPAERFLVPWAVSIEALLRSALHHPDSAVAIYPAPNPQQVLDFPWQRDNFPAVPFWENRALKELNPRYMQLPESLYQYLNQPDTLSASVLSEKLRASAVVLKPAVQSSVPGGKEVKMNVMLKNSLNSRISSNQSNPHPLGLQYIFYQAGDEAPVFTSPFIPLLADIPGNGFLKQPVMLYTQGLKGDYKIVVRLYSPSLSDWFASETAFIHVR